MTDQQKRIRELTARINAAEPGTRHGLQPELERLIHELEAASVLVPPELRDLNEILLGEAIEAQFDNMPV